MNMKEFVAEFRYPGPLGNWPEIVWKIIRASSEKEARLIGKGLAGRGDDMKWFMGIRKEETAAYRRGELTL